jgi:hypothetical protein
MPTVVDGELVPTPTFPEKLALVPVKVPLKLSAPTLEKLGVSRVTPERVPPDMEELDIVPPVMEGEVITVLVS